MLNPEVGANQSELLTLSLPFLPGMLNGAMNARRLSHGLHTLAPYFNYQLAENSQTKHVLLDL